MHCPSCGYENPAGLKFCNDCGTPLTLRCGSCGFENAPQAKFCGECGTALSAAGIPAPAKDRKRQGANTRGRTSRAAARPTPRRLPAAAPEAERRQLTVMFCDLVGSTPLSEKLDPEDLREVVRAYQETCAVVIHHFDGYIARYVGDALLVYFGYPQAHEDDAPRAVRAGLDIVAALPELNHRLHPVIGAQQAEPLQVRIGIHTGLVVVGELGGKDYREAMALGETPNLAARLQGIAVPDTVVISAATQRLIAGLFTCQDLGLQELKGVSTPVPVYCVLSESGVQSRFEVAVRKGLTPLVGREEELGLLRRRWEQAKEGTGQVVLLSGEPGIGKSRLVQEFKDQLAHAGVTRIEFRCSPYHQNSALYPVIEHMQWLLEFQRGDSPEEKLHRLEVGTRLRPDSSTGHVSLQPEAVPLFAALLSLPHPGGYPPLNLSPQKQKQKTQEALVAWLLAEAERKTVLATWEDVHWADPSTLEVLNLVVDQAPTACLYVLLTFRPEFIPPWGNRSHLSQMTLSRLVRPQVETMVERVTVGKALPPEVMQQIVSKTDGVPLFVEELTKMVVESGLVREEAGRYVGAHGGAPIPSLAIPSTLQDSLMARLDRLSTVREIAQLGATIGREFNYELIHAVSPLDEVTLQHGLKQLVGAELVYQRGLVSQAHYLFKHALLQDTAYQSLLKSTRQQYHRQIAQILEAQFTETVETQPELLAHHYTEAGLIAQAIPYWQRAGQRANERLANVEAISHLTKGLELLKTLADTPGRIQQELTLQLALGDALVTVKGYTAPEVEKTVLRARALCQRLGETPQLFPVLWRLVLFYINQRELQTTRELAEQLRRLAQSVQDPYLLSLAHAALGCTLFWLGELVSARLHLEQAITLYDPQKHPRPTVNTADPRVDCLSYASWTLWFLGYPDQGLKRSQEAVALAGGLSHPFSLAYALGVAAVFHLLRREGQLARQRAEEVITLSTEQGFPSWLATGMMVQGGALAEQGWVQEGIAQMRQSRATRPVVLAWLAEAYGKVGQVEEGLTVLAEALALVSKTGERVGEAEMYRLKGELSLQSGVRSPQSEITSPQLPTPSPKAEAEAEACFHKAIEVARRQSAKSLELRAVMSLSRLWRRQGKKAEARQLLAEIYGWFTEGFDTKDLQEAKALLEELGS